jgi:hypothetical protein
MNTSSSPHVSVIPIPELFTYALYIVITFMLEVIYIYIGSIYTKTGCRLRIYNRVPIRDDAVEKILTNPTSRPHRPAPRRCSLRRQRAAAPSGGSAPPSAFRTSLFLPVAARRGSLRRPPAMPPSPPVGSGAAWLSTVMRPDSGPSRPFVDATTGPYSLRAGTASSTGRGC